MTDDEKFSNNSLNTQKDSATAINERHQILEMANEAYISIDAESRIINWNPYASHVFGWTKEEAMGQYLYDLIIPQQYRDAHKKGMDRFLVTGQGHVLGKTIEITALHKTKGEFPIELNIFPILIDQHYTFHALIRDITERKLAEETTRNILEATPDAMIISNEDGKITFLNTQTEKIFGYRQDELLGRKVEMLILQPYRSRHPEHRRDFFNNPSTRPMGIGMELYCQRKNKEIFPAEISLSPLNTKNGMVTLTAIRDITERKKAEEKLTKLHKALLNSARNAGMAEVSNAILHNLGNILNSSNVSIGILLDQTKRPRVLEEFKKIANLINEHASTLSDFLIKDEKGKLIPKYLVIIGEQMEKEYELIAKEIQDLNKHFHIAIETISKQESLSGHSILLEKFSIKEILESAITICDIENSDIIINYNIDNISEVYTDKNKVLQILINLIMNAKESLLSSNNTNKSLTISFKKIQDNYFHLIIQDNGVGISSENIGHIFSFGFTTKNEGNGFGLHNSFLLAKELGGTLEVKSKGIDKGATFILALPNHAMR